MPRKPASITQADVARTIRAARQAGARAVEIRFANGTTVSVKLTDSVDSDDAPLAPDREAVL